MQGVKAPPEVRFWQHVNKLPNGCWEWTAATRGGGYGALWGTTSHLVAHRFSYELLVGPIPAGLTLDHLCRNRKCVNPAHLEIVTRGENTLRGNTITGINKRKTHCNKGHLLAGDNVRFYNGKRICRECKRANELKHKMRRQTNEQQ